MRESPAREGRLAVGVIGAGKISTSCHLPVLANTDGVEVEYVADVDGSQAKEVARAFDARAVEVGSGGTRLPASDVALLAVPVGVRESYFEAFGERSIPVFSEKPFATGAAEHRRFADLVPAVSCNYLRLSFGATRQARRLVDAGVFGELERVRYAEGGVVGATGRSQESYQSDAALRGGGMLLERGCHGLSQLVYLLEEWDLSVEDATVEWEDDFDVDVEASLAATRDGRSVPVEYTLTRVRPVETVAEFVFEHGTIAFDPEDPEAQVSVRATGSAAPWSAAARPTFERDGRWASTFAQAAALRWQEFLSLVDPSAEPASTPRTMPAVTDLIEEIYERSPPAELEPAEQAPAVEGGNA